MKSDIFRFVINLHALGTVDLGDFACVHPLQLTRAYAEFDYPGGSYLSRTNTSQRRTIRLFNV